MGTHLPEIVPSDADNKTVCEFMDQVEKAVGGSLQMGKSDAYRRLVSSCLYDGVKYDRSILGKELLIALGAMLMGSRRGSVKEVFNFNFDDVLDWYLALHGFDSQIISSLPTLRREPDVTIYHPHGYLPLQVDTHQPSDFLVFSQHSYDEKLGDRQEPWLSLFGKTLQDRVFLFVGLSGADQTFGPTLADVQKKLNKQRYTAFWLFGPDVQDSQMKNLANRNVVPLRFPSFDDIPEFILQVCKEALKI